MVSYLNLYDPLDVLIICKAFSFLWCGGHINRPKLSGVTYASSDSSFTKVGTLSSNDCQSPHESTSQSVILHVQNSAAVLCAV